MQIHRRHLAGLMAGLVAARPALAQNYPDRPVRIVVPTGAGGITDIIARIVARHLGDRLGQPVLVDNRPGASGVIGTEAVVRGPADGYTLLMVFPSHPVNLSLKARMPYDTVRDLAPVTMISSFAHVLEVPAALPVRSVTQLIEAARRQPLTYGSVGPGSLGHLCAELFCSMAGITMTGVQYRALPDIHTAMMRGEIAAFFDAPITALPMLREGTFRALGVSSMVRLPVLPEVPTVSEAGLPGYEALGWNGILVKAGTPPQIIERLNTEIRAVVSMPEVTRQLSEAGVDPTTMPSEEFGRRIEADVEKWGQIIRRAGISPN
jgi:tripartite-type tricarboxylate transporter receptor subunit TctC